MSSKENKVINFLKCLSNTVAFSNQYRFLTNIWSIIYNNKWIGVKNNSSIGVYSTNGMDWNQSTLPNSKFWTSLATNGTTSVAVASQSDVSLSTIDGITWIENTLPSYGSWKSVASDGSNFVAVKLNSNKGVRSTDGITWVEVTLPFTGNWVSVVWNGTIFCALSSNSPSVATSTDGVVWTERPFNNPSLNNLNWQAMTWALGQFTAIADSNDVIISSTDGIVWESSLLPLKSNWNSIGPGVNSSSVNCITIIAKNTSLSLSSTDGKNWAINYADVTDQWKAIGGVIGKFAYVMKDLKSKFIDPIYTTIDKVNWLSGFLPRPLSNCIIAYSGDTMKSEYNTLYPDFKDFGGDAPVFSVDGINWTKPIAPVFYVTCSTFSTSTSNLLINYAHTNKVVSLMLGALCSSVSIPGIINKAITKKTIVTSNASFTSITNADGSMPVTKPFIGS